MLVLLTGFISILLAVFQAKRITRPIVELAETSLAVAKGKVEQRVAVTVNNEIGQLASAFNHMLEIRQSNEYKLNSNHQKLQQTMADLSEQKFALDQHAIVASTDVQGTITFVNDKFSQISGFRKTELIGQNHRLLNSGHHAKAFFKDLYRTISSGKVWHGEICNRAKNGHLYWVDTTIVPFMGRNNKPQSYIAIRTDISAQKQAEKDITESKKRLELVIENTEVGIWDWYIQTTSVSFNQRWAKIIGYDLEELMPINLNTWHSYIHPDDLPRYKQALKQYWDGDTERYACELRMHHKQGHWVWIFDTGKTVELLASGQPDRMIGTCLDISLHKENELVLEKAKEDAESATRMKSEFLANMSHEIRTPMNAVIGFGDILLQTNLTEKQRSYMNTLSLSAHALLTLINDILDFSKIEAGKLQIEEIDFDLQTTLDKVSDLLINGATQKGLEFITVLDKDIPSALRGDPLRLTQIMTNLISNAIKFTETGDVLVKVKLIDFDNDNDHVYDDDTQNIPFVKLHFCIEDTGIGLSELQISNLFQSFTQADGSMSRKYGGTGLGLAISKQLVELMGGKIGVTSQAGKGSQFWFTLCFAKQTKQQTLLFQTSTQLRGMKVLSVEHQSDPNSIINLLLRSFSFNPILAKIDDSTIIDTLKQQTDIKLVIIHCSHSGHKATDLANHIEQAFDGSHDMKPKVIMILPFQAESLEQVGNHSFIDAILDKPLNQSRLFNTIIDEVFKQKIEPTKPNTEGAYYITPLDMQLILQDAQVLLVEDNNINQQLASEILLQEGIQITLADNGQHALERLAAYNGFDAILMDVQMPIMNGYEATQQIRNHSTYQHLPIIAMTAHALAGDEQKCLEAGMDDYISKPIEVAQLLEKLSKWIKSSRKQAPKLPAELESSHENKLAEASIDILSRQLAGIDVADLLLRVRGNQVLCIEILNSFENDYTQGIKDIRLIIEKADISPIIAWAHTLKGVSANLSMTPLSTAAENLEIAARHKSEVDFKPLLNSIEQNLSEVLNSIASLKQNSVSNPENSLVVEITMDKTALSEALTELSSLLKRRKTQAKKHWKALRPQLAVDEWQGNVTTLDQLINRFKFKEAEVAIEELLKSM